MYRWMQHLFKRQDQKTPCAMARRLSLFRFFKALGGHANDGDSLDVAYAYGGTAQLDAFLAGLGIELLKYDAPPPQPLPGVAYAGDVFLQFPTLIDGTLCKQPGHCHIKGIAVFIWCHAGVVKISLSDGYVVSEQNVRDAAVIEKMLAGVALERVAPPADSKQYFCP